MLEFIDDVIPLIRRSYELATGLSINPNATNPLLQGEWLEEFAADGLVATRGSVNPAIVPAYPIFSERGRSDTQAINKVSLILGPSGSQADTDIFDSTGITLGEGLCVADVTIASLTKRGLVQASGAGKVVAYCTKLPANNGNKLRFRLAA